MCAPASPPFCHSKSGDVPNLTLVVGRTTVHTSAGTAVRRRGDVQGLSALAVGQTVEVEGTRRADGTVDAKKIVIEDDEPDGPFEIEVPRSTSAARRPTLSDHVLRARRDWPRGIAAPLAPGSRV